MFGLLKCFSILFFIVWIPNTESFKFINSFGIKSGSSLKLSSPNENTQPTSIKERLTNDMKGFMKSKEKEK